MRVIARIPFPRRGGRALRSEPCAGPGSPTASKRRRVIDESTGPQGRELLEAPLLLGERIHPIAGRKTSLELERSRRVADLRTRDVIGGGRTGSPSRGPGAARLARDREDGRRPRGRFLDGFRRGGRRRVRPGREPVSRGRAPGVLDRRHGGDPGAPSPPPSPIPGRRISIRESPRGACRGRRYDASHPHRELRGLRDTGARCCRSSSSWLLPSGFARRAMPRCLRTRRSPDRCEDAARRAPGCRSGAHEGARHRVSPGNGAATPCPRPRGERPPGVTARRHAYSGRWFGAVGRVD